MNKHNSTNYIDAVYLDFSKAFDKINKAKTAKYPAYRPQYSGYRLTHSI